MLHRSASGSVALSLVLLTAHLLQAAAPGARNIDDPPPVELVDIESSTKTTDENHPKPGVWPIDRLKTEVPRYRYLNNTGPIHALLYAGQSIGGEPTEVFAFYASPRTIGDVDNTVPVPGIVLIHGGGGTAFSDWVWMWARRGYAAIAMDLSGRRPPEPRFDESGAKTPDFQHRREQRRRLENGGLDQTHAEKFQSIGGTIDDDWPYHAVANVIRAHTLLRSFPEVDDQRTAVTGISWGGYTTCLVASLDNRFKAAVPVYGCGFLYEGESIQKPAIDALGPRRGDWIAAYDPSSHLGRCTVPTFWVNGTHDRHYVLDSYARSYSLVQGETTFRIQPRMNHSHAAGWAPAEIGIYIDSKLRRGTPLPRVGGMIASPSGTVTATIVSDTPIKEVRLHYTEDIGIRSERSWKSIPARYQDGQAIAAGLPASANTWLMTITDERGAIVTTGVEFRDEKHVNE